MTLLGELKRRNVFRVVAAYVVLSWLMLQAGDILFDALDLPDWTMKLVLALLAIGFVPVVVFSWVYELTPEGVKKESEVDRTGSITYQTGRKLDLITIGMIALGVAIVALDRWVLPEPVQQAVPPSAAPGAGAEAPERSDAVAEQGEPSPSVQPETDRSIAVLPFADMSPDQDQGYFSDGIAEEILNVLVRIDDLKVASRTSSFAYRGRQQNLSAIADELKVQNILEGSVRKAGNQVRITAQLIDAKTDRHLWSETFDRELTDIFAIQDEIATAVVEALVGTLGAETRPSGRLVEVATENLNAYDLFLKGREMFVARERIGEAIEVMQQSVELDPGFARAWEVLAALLSVAPSWGQRALGDNDTYRTLSDQAANRALELDGERYLAIAILGQNMADREPVDWDEVLALHDRAIDINSRDATLYLWRGILFRVLGFPERGDVDLDRCLEIDPAYENCRNNRVFSDFDLGRVEDAFDWLDRSLTELSVRHDVLYPFFVPDLVRRGELRTAYLMADVSSVRFDGDSRPIHWWITGLQNPESDHGETVERLERWSEATGRDLFPLVWVSLGAYDKVETGFPLRQVLWRHDMGAFRRSARFKQIIREWGILGHWRVHGFPERCRPLGDGDFECD